ncbi:hypothetical protein YC2023_020346 [Brassica napus]
MGSFRRRTFSYDKLPTGPIRLSVLKLDGTSFDVNVTSSATVRDLKLAIETAFSHVPKKGPSKISWYFTCMFLSHYVLMEISNKCGYMVKVTRVGTFLLVLWGSEASHRYGVHRKLWHEGRERAGPKNEAEEVNRVEEIDHGSWDDLEKGSLVRYEDGDMEASPEDNRTSLTTVHGCCFAFGLKELLGFGNDKSYYSLRDTWRDD